MRREIIQVIAVLAIAAGAGLFAYGRHLDPPFNPANPASMIPDRGMHAAASVATGVGVAFMTFGGLALVVPYTNVLLARCCDDRNPPVA